MKQVSTFYDSVPPVFQVAVACIRKIKFWLFFSISETLVVFGHNASLEHHSCRTITSNQIQTFMASGISLITVLKLQFQKAIKRLFSINYNVEMVLAFNRIKNGDVVADDKKRRARLERFVRQTY